MTAQFDIVWTDTALHDPLNIADDIADRDSVDAAEHVFDTIADAVRGLDGSANRVGAPGLEDLVQARAVELGEVTQQRQPTWSGQAAQRPDRRGRVVLLGPPERGGRR